MIITAHCADKFHLWAALYNYELMVNEVTTKHVIEDWYTDPSPYIKLDNFYLNIVGDCMWQNGENIIYNYYWVQRNHPTSLPIQIRMMTKPKIIKYYDFELVKL